MQEGAKTKVAETKLPVIYYLSRNGQLEHPHLIEVSLSSPPATLSLKDVIDRMNFLRGDGMANMYSWSSKRSFKNGFVWQDLCENDLIYPCHGHEYILKGSPIIGNSQSFQSSETISWSNSKTSSQSERNSSSIDSFSPAIAKKWKKNRSWSSCDYQLCKAKAANAWTVTQGKYTADVPGNEEAETYERAVKDSRWEEGCLERVSMEICGSVESEGKKVERDFTSMSGRNKPSTALLQLIMRCGSSKDPEPTIIN